MSRLKFHMGWVYDLHLFADDDFQVKYQEGVLYRTDNYEMEQWFMDELCTGWESLSHIETIMEAQGLPILDTIFDPEHADIGDENAYESN